MSLPPLPRLDPLQYEVADIADTADDIALDDIDRRLVARGGLWEFVKLAWHQVEASSLVESWHLRLICAHLEAVSRGECKRLIITIPPGCTKSTLVSVLWPVWDWLINPRRRWMMATFDAALAYRDSMRCRGLLRSPWFMSRWGATVGVAEGADNQMTQSVWSTRQRGRRVSVTVGGRAIGWHADIQVVDDPTKPKDIAGDPDKARAALERTSRWYAETMASRRSDPKNFARVIIMQRLHQDDLVGSELRKDGESWTVVSLPMRYEEATKCVTPWGVDPRTVEGELLAPERFDEAAVKDLEKTMGAQVAAAQLQQRPSPAGGNVFKRDWFNGSFENPRRWKVLPAGLTMVQSWDLALKDTAGSDYVAGHVWGMVDDKFYLIDRVHDRMGAPDIIRLILMFTRRWPRAFGKLIEDAASGPAVEQIIRKSVTGLIMMKPADMGGKIARANAVSPLIEAGNVYLPDPTAMLTAANGDTIKYQWVDGMLEELIAFPFAHHDDDVDAMTQALIYLDGRSIARYLAAMTNIAAGRISVNGANGANGVNG